MEIELLVRAVIEDHGRFLIAHTKGAHNMYLPGGHVEAGESLKYALARELKDELERWGLFEEYQDRFLDIFKKKR